MDNIFGKSRVGRPIFWKNIYWGRNLKSSGIAIVLLSLFFGPIQSASRVYFVKKIPVEKKYEFFGFYSFSGKVTSFIGPVLYGTIAYSFSSPKMGMASLLILFFIGLLIVLKVENDQ